MKGKMKTVLLALAMGYFLTGCQKGGALADASEIELSREREKDVVQTEEGSAGVYIMTEETAAGETKSEGTGPEETGAKEIVTKETGVKETGAEEIVTKETGGEETGVKEIGVEEIVTKETGGEETGGKETGGEETGPEETVTKEGISGLSEMENTSFYYTNLTEDIKARITGGSYPDTEEPLQISYEELRYVHVLHYDFEGTIQQGELICNQAIAQDLVDIFYELYESQYPIERICLIDEYGADDEASMADNNTSCFNYRPVSGTAKLSNHAYGCAIDINPLYNPYVRTRGGKELVSPDNAVPYADRSADFPYKIDQNDLCYRLFAEHGFTWGGAWKNSKDYQHFEKIVRDSSGE